MRKLFTLLLAVAASVGTMFASTKIGDLYYNLDATSQTAEVTSQNSSYPKWSTSITTANIPASVEYNSVTYSVTSIGNEAFDYCKSLTSVTIPNSVTSIGNEAFYYCKSLTSVTIPNSVTRIGSQAFSGCSGLTSVTIGNSVTSIGYGTFDGCSGLTSVTIPNGVTSIGNETFKNCSGLTSIEIPNSVTSIGSWAFDGCTGLTSITLPNSVTSIGMGAFSVCTGLTSVTISNSVTSIGDEAFSGCTGLTSIEIPNSVTSIGMGAFSVCSGLTSIVVENGNSMYDSRNCNAIIETATNTLIAGCQNTIIPNSVTSIGDRAFAVCTGLTSIEIPNSVTSIGGGAFAECRNLTSVTIPNSVTSIGSGAFANCIALTSVTIPNSVTSIGYVAFINCKKLSSIYNYATSPQVIDSEVFGGEEFEQDGVKYGPVDKSLCKLYVPQESIDLYKAAEGWKEFVNILPLEDTPIETDEVVFVTTETTADMSWQEVTNAYTYELIIRDGNGAIVCTLVFDAEGHLKSITFHAPERNNNVEHTLQAGFSFTINGLASGTTYSYTFLAKDSGGNVVKTITGTFTTQGEEQGIDQVPSDQVQSTKVIKNGQVFILRGDKTYTLQGQEVK